MDVAPAKDARLAKGPKGKKSQAGEKEKDDKECVVM
jgi:hypothetical protein